MTMKRHAFLIVALFAAGPASAEVCDKVVGEWWRPEHGHASPLVPITPWNWASDEGWKIAVLAIVMLVLYAKKMKGAAWVAGALLGVAALHSLFMAGPFAADFFEILEAAVREGCLSASLLPGRPPRWIPIAWLAAAVSAFFLLRARNSRGAASAA